MVGPPKTDCPRVREKVIWESLYPILGSIRPHGLALQLHFSLEVSTARLGLVSASPE
jgi:hypothetical protein